jgi:hypothetical protein
MRRRNEKEAKERNARKSTFAYSFHAVFSTTRTPPSGVIRSGPSSTSAPSNEEQPGPPLSLRGLNGQRSFTVGGSRKRTHQMMRRSRCGRCFARERRK